MSDSTTSALLAALNSAEELAQRDYPLAREIATVHAGRELPVSTKVMDVDFGEGSRDRLAVTICLSMEKLRSAT